MRRVGFTGTTVDTLADLEDTWGPQELLTQVVGD